jgi:predicted O-methyltransferase YrrM
MFFKAFETRPEVAEAAGFHVHPRRFDSPLPLMEEISFAALEVPRDLPGIDLRTTAALELIQQLRPLAAELDSIPYGDSGEGPLYRFNQEFLDSFPDFDAAVLHALLRHVKPRRYVELGCGYSSLVSSAALRRNADEGTECEAVYADPEPRLAMSEVLTYATLLRKRVQDLPLNTFTKLESGDVLFIDTSHVLKIQSDVEQELLRILPSLQPGVWIHFHDIFTPYDYPADWVRQPVRLGCNEQYGLECLLSGGDRYQVEIPLHYLGRDHKAKMLEFFPRGQRRAHSIWIRKVR